jgi:hypothetical protein
VDRISGTDSIVLSGIILLFLIDLLPIACGIALQKLSDMGRVEQVAKGSRTVHDEMWLVKPSAGIAVESVSNLQQPAAGEELAGVRRIDLDSDARFGGDHVRFSSNFDGRALAA